VRIEWFSVIVSIIFGYSVIVLIYNPRMTDVYRVIGITNLDAFEAFAAAVAAVVASGFSFFNAEQMLSAAIVDVSLHDKSSSVRPSPCSPLNT
jgi:hypothetical protein